MTQNKHWIVTVEGADNWRSSVYIIAPDEVTAWCEAELLRPQTWVVFAREIPTYQIPFLCGDGTPEIMLTVQYAHRDGLVGWNQKCPFCENDPYASHSSTDTLIGAYFARNAWAESCPCCSGNAP